MATALQQGIMALPENDQVNAPPKLGLDDSYDAAKSGAMEANPELTSQLEAQMAEAMPELEQMPEEQLNALLQLLQYMHDHPEEYKKIVQMLVEQGKFSEGDLPPEYDDQFIATMTMILLEARRQRGMAEITPAASQQAAQPMQPPAQFARGGIADAARAVAAKGRSGDTMLAHITPKEAKMLRKKGGAGTINPATGLPEYGLIGDIVGAVKSSVKTVVNVTKKVLASPVGKIAATIAIASFIGPYAASMGLGTAGTAALTMAGASAGITALSGGNLKDIIKSGTMGAVLGYGGAVLGPALAPAGWGAGATAAVGAGAAGAGLGLVQGKSINDAVQQGISAAALAGLTTYVQTGMYSQPNQPTTVEPTGEVVTRGIAPQSTDTNAGTGLTSDGGVTDQSVLAPSQPNANTGLDAAGNAMDQSVTGPASTWRAPVSVKPEIVVPPEGYRYDVSTGTMRPDYQVDPTDYTMYPSSNPPPPPGAEKGYWDQTKQFYNENISPSGIRQAGVENAINARNTAIADYQARYPNASAADVKAIGDAAYAANTPGVVGTYGPAVAGGLLAVKAMGGFKPKQPEPEPGSVAEQMKGTPGEDIVRANPKAYIAQNLPGVTYDEAGNVVSSSTWTPSGTMADVRAGSSGYIPYNAPQQRLPAYQPQQQPTGYGQPQYNFRPQYAAQGGIMEKMPQHYAAGGFTQSPLSADPGPMMAMQAHSVPMNTSGVPMNLPMHFASGGSASSKLAEAMASGNPGGIFSGIQPAMNAMIGKSSGMLGLGVPGVIMDVLSGKDRLTSSASAPIITPPASSAMGPVNYAYAPAQVSPYAANPQASATAAKMVAAAKQAVATLPQGVNLSNMTARVPTAKAMGGIASLATGGYPRRNGQISGPGTETSDSIPAMLSDGEFVMTAKAVRGAGKGDRRAGAKKMYALMHQLEKNAARG